MLAFSAHASIVMMEISEGGVDISGNYNPYPASTNTTTSAGVNLEVSASGIYSSYTKYSPISPIYPYDGSPSSVVVSGAGQGGANGTYLYYLVLGGRPVYKKGDYYFISFDIFDGWTIKYTEFTDLKFYKSYSRTTYPPKSSWVKLMGGDTTAPTIAYEGGEDPTSAPPDMVLPTAPTDTFPPEFSDFAPTVAPVSANRFTPAVAEFVRSAESGDTISLTGEDL